MSDNNSKDGANLTRRAFLGVTTATAATAALMATGSYVHAQGSGKIRVGVIGCGGRGGGAARDILQADPEVEIYAIGDLFPERANGGREQLLKEFPGRINVTPERTFSGFDAYKKVLAQDVKIVILATPPGFRPTHFQAAIEAGKNVFMEKPVAVDPNGVRSVIATADLAAQKGLAVVAGTQRRHQVNYIETIKRIHDGAIGDVVSAQCYWNQGGLWMHPRQPAWSDMEWQLRNWLYFTWLSGDHITEQHVHNLDVINWVMKAHPIKAVGMGGRQVRTDPAYGHIFDHFAVEYEYPNGMKLLSMCRQIDGTAPRVEERVVGTKGTSNPGGSIRGENSFRYEAPIDPATGKPKRPISPYVQEHIDLIKSIRDGKPLNEGRQIAESTLTAIMGRLSAYTGQEVTWDQMVALPLDLMPEKIEFGTLAVAPVPTPGRSTLLEGGRPVPTTTVPAAETTAEKKKG
jgi:predicted dehydrogenase